MNTAKLAWTEEVYDETTGEWVETGEAEETEAELAFEGMTVMPKLVCQSEVWDDETGTWVSEGEAEEIDLEWETELLWEQELTAKALLERRERPFGKSEAFSLCAAVILDDLGADVLDALLEICPPLEEVLDQGRVDYPAPEFWDGLGLVELAAYLGRDELLDVLLRRGGNVNARPGWAADPVSPLDAAAWGGSEGCVDRLLAEPGLDRSFSTHLRRLYEEVELAEERRWCLERIARAGTV